MIAATLREAIETAPQSQSLGSIMRRCFDTFGPGPDAGLTMSRSLAKTSRSFWITLLLLAEIAVAVVVGFATSPHLEKEFFVVASEILPVLLLAAIIDLRPRTTAGTDRRAATALVVSFVIGEAVALALVGNRKHVITSSWWLGIVAASLVGLALLILVTSLTEACDT